jgi:glycosyltransferase involved in cell wall biosynthesis
VIKILKLIDGGFIGGGQIHILSVCNNISKDLFKVIVCASPDGAFKNYVQSSDYEFRDIYLPKLFRNKYLNELRNIVQKEDIDIIHAHGGVAGMYARFYKKKFGDKVKVIHTIHGIHYIHSKNIFRKKLSLYIEQYLANHSDAYICVSNDDLKVGTENKILDPSKTEVINNGIDLNKFKPINASKINRDGFGLCDSDFVIGNLSRFDEQKNQRLLVEIMPDILKHIPNAKLLLVGDGELLDSVKKLASNSGLSEYVKFAGAKKDVEKMYPLMDVFVFPSMWEGLSLTLIETLATGRCILASDIPANRELINDNDNGMLFDLSDKKKLVDIIVGLYNDKDKRASLSKNALISSLKYDDKVMTGKIENLYLNIINKS